MILMIQAEIFCLQKTDDFKGFEAVLMRNLFKRELLCLLPRVLKRLRAFDSKSFLEISQYQTWLSFTCVFFSKCFPLPLENIFLFLERVKSQCGEDIRLKMKMWFPFSRKCQKREYKKRSSFFLECVRSQWWRYQAENNFFFFFLSRTCEKPLWKRYSVENRSQQTLLSFFYVNPQGTGLSTEATTIFVSNAENFVQNYFSQIN